jgi:hypothetical protein
MCCTLDKLSFGGKLERQPLNGNTTKILQTRAGGPYTFCILGVHALEVEGHRSGAKVWQYGCLRK